MRFNKYTIKIENGNSTILYNLITKMLIEIDYKLSDVDKFLINNFDEDTKLSLLDGMILSKNKNEKEDFEKFIKIREYYNNSNYTGRFIIHLGYKCNLNCEYCYQSKVNKLNSIKEDDIINFISNTIDTEKYSNLDICFIGGEPLIYFLKIEKIANFLSKNFSDKCNIRYSIVTNSTLLNNKQIMNVLINSNINDIQVTIDGDKDTHDSLRYYNNNRGSFDNIICNIKNIINSSNNINISINCNISNVNYDKIEKLLIFLKKNNIKVPLFFSLIFDSFKENNYSINKIDTKWYEVHKLAIKYGYEFEPFYRDMYLGCAMIQKNYHIIGADGNLYKCINAVDNIKYLLTRTKEFNSKEYKSKIKKFLKYSINKKMCEDCNLYPICYGGCEYMNSIHGFKCDKKFYIENEYAIIKEQVNPKNRKCNKKI